MKQILFSIFIIASSSFFISMNAHAVICRTYAQCSLNCNGAAAECCESGTGTIYTCPEGWTAVGSTCKRSGTDAGSDSKGYKKTKYGTCTGTGTTQTCYMCTLTGCY